jgi:hypothetical protein
LCNSDDEVLAGGEGDVLVVGVEVLVAEEERGGAGLGEVAGLFGVKTLEAAQDEVVVLDYFGLLGVVGIAGHRGIQLIKMLSPSDASGCLCGLFVHF